MIREYLRTLTVAALTLSVLAMPGSLALSKNTHPDDDGVRCAYFDRESGTWRFYLPGATLLVSNGNGSHVLLECGKDGSWTLAKPTQQSGDGQTSTGSNHQMP